MDYEVCDISDEFEPRLTPRPAPRFECPTVPSVPEVSLVFDKPPETRHEDAEKNRVPRSPSIDGYGSYAAWKQKNFVAQKGYESPMEMDPRRDSLHKNVSANDSLKNSCNDPGLAEKIESLGYLRDYEKEQMLKVIKEREAISSPSHRRVDHVSRNQERDRQYLARSSPQNVRDNGQRKPNIQSTASSNDVRSCVIHPNPSSRAQNTQHPNYSPGNPNFDSRYSNFHQPALQNSGFNHRSPESESFQNFPPNMFQRYPFSAYFDSYPYPCPPNFQTQKNENEDTVKNLLQLVNSQSEQIKSLQAQVERLLKIQEESLKNRAKCNCSHNEQTMQNMLCLPTNKNGRDQSSGPRDESRLSQRQTSTVERNSIQYDSATRNVNTGNDYHNQACDNRLNLSLVEDQMKNKILEQKVSIGVMTSFEFTVQNNPFATEIEEHQPRRCYESNSAENNTAYRYQGNGRNMPETSDVLRNGRNENVFSRVSNVPLENIIEDSESHISSSRQPSSNFHPSPTTEELLSDSVIKRTEKNSPLRFICGNSQEGEKSNSVELEKRHQVSDSQRRFESNQRSQSPRIPENTPRARDLLENDVQRQKHLENQSQRCLRNLRQELGAQNIGLKTIGNLDSPARNRLAKNECYNIGTFTQNKQHAQNEFSNGNTPNKGRVNMYTNDSMQNRHETINTEKRDHSGQTPRSKSMESVDKVEERSVKTSSEKNNPDNYVEESIVLDLKERPPPSPEPSIHVDMQEYTSDDESERDKQKQNPKQSAKVGWTFYNNVLGQVNQILENSPIAANTREKQIQRVDVTETRRNIKDDSANVATMDAVKMATMEQLRKLGISFVENADPKDVNEISNKKVTFDSSYYPRVEYMTQATSAMSETDTSMQMDALALKYLSDEQLGALALQKHRNGRGAETMKHLMVSNVQGTNMSFATMRYLERYQLLPGITTPQADDEGKENFDLKNGMSNTPTRPIRVHRPPPTIQTTRTSYPSKILDISTLKQQPKLL